MANADQRSEACEANVTCGHGLFAWAALGVACAALAGSLFLSLAMNLKACPLCFYQRTFVMSIVAVLATGLVLKAGRGAGLSLLALPLAAAGTGVALFHVYLETSGTLECPAGVLGIGTAPQQSLAMFLVVLGLLAVDAVRCGSCWEGFAGTLVIGGLLALASCTSNPPMPAAPSQPYTTPLEVCRPPYQAP